MQFGYCVLVTLDPRTPVLVGYGQINQHDDSATAPGEPVELMARAARRAADDAVLAAVDTVAVVNLLSWKYRDPGLLLAEKIGARPARTGYTGVGGNMPQTLVNRACRDILAGRAEVVLLAGGETWRTNKRLKATGAEPPWTVQDEAVPQAEVVAEGAELAGPAQLRVHLLLPSHVYLLFEQAIRVTAGTAPEQHRARLGGLWQRFNAVAQHNPHAWNRRAVGAEEIWRDGPDNRMISWPYTKLMNSNNMVDQGAALVLTSVRRAGELGIPRDTWVFPWSGTDAHDTYDIAERAAFDRSPAIRIAGERALALAGLGVDDIDLVDVYSCFPSAVQIAAAELGLAVDDDARPLTVTGGLTFAGGPWNNYVMHSIATMAERLAAGAGARGLIPANGGYLTKHAFGVYGTEPPPDGFRWADVQDEVDREPTRTAAPDFAGTGRVETWTTPVGRDGTPEKVFATVDAGDGRRAIAVVHDPAQAAASTTEDLAGAAIEVRPDGTAELG